MLVFIPYLSKDPHCRNPDFNVTAGNATFWQQILQIGNEILAF
jgi:hypothetical protein